MPIQVNYTTTQGLYFMDATIRISIMQLEKRSATLKIVFHSPDNMFPDQIEILTIGLKDTINITEFLKKVNLESHGLTKKGAMLLNEELIKQFYTNIDEGE